MCLCLVDVYCVNYVMCLHVSVSGRRVLRVLRDVSVSGRHVLRVLRDVSACTAVHTQCHVIFGELLLQQLFCSCDLF